jgi:hypothetical protein
MTLEGIYEILLRGLTGTLPPTALHYIGPEEAHAELKRRTGQDFGRDVEAWRNWIDANVEPIQSSVAQAAGCDAHRTG